MRGAAEGWPATLRLDLIHPKLRKKAVTSLDEGDPDGFLICARNGNQDHLNIVWQNRDELQRRDLYEKTLLSAFIATRTNNHQCALDTLNLLFEIADRERLLAAGDPLPGPGPFTLYRGVAGRTRARRIRGLSWTGSLERAKWFAERGENLGLADPAVFKVTVNADAVLAYSNERNEQEFIVLLPESARPVRV